MHNLGNQFYQTQQEIGSNYESGYELSPEFELSNENEYSQEYNGESQYELLPEYESEGPQYETLEMELAQELMEVQNEAEFLDWIKSTAKKAAGVASNFLDSPTGQQATGALINIAQKTLPSAGAAGGGFLGKKGGEALGGYFGGSAGSKIGGAIGGKLGSWGGEKAGQWAADRFPSFVRFTSDTLRNLSKEVRTGKAPAIKPALISAATKHYPIILQVKGTLGARIVNQQGKNGNGTMSKELYGETSYEDEFNQEGRLDEVTEMELASELLSLNSEAELDHFFGKLFKKIGKGVSGLVKGPLGGMLKGLAKKALPFVGGALGSVVPGVGTAIGSAVGSAASNLFELELEGLSAEDREFEMARAFTRFASDAARRTSSMGNMNPSQAARLGIVNAARRHAPGLINRRRPRGSRYGGGSSYQNNYIDNSNNTDTGDGSGGNWYREGNKIVIQDAFSN